MVAGMAGDFQHSQPALGALRDSGHASAGHSAGTALGAGGALVVFAHAGHHQHGGSAARAFCLGDGRHGHRHTRHALDRHAGGGRGSGGGTRWLPAARLEPQRGAAGLPGRLRQLWPDGRPAGQCAGPIQPRRSGAIAGQARGRAQRLYRPVRALSLLYAAQHAGAV